MKLSTLLIIIATFGLLIFGCTPDIVTPNLTVGTPSINASGSVQVPATVTVRNIGDGSAGQFKVAMWYKPPDSGPFVVQYMVPGQSNTWYPYTAGSLGEGDEETFTGVVTFIPQVHNIIVDMWAEGDSCAGDEFMESYCRVKEKDEGNNNSPSITLNLP